jgi:hypothetical protein
MSCITKITGGFALDCANLPIAGLESDIVLINIDDVDKAATTFNVSNELLVTNFQLKAGRTGYALQGVKQSNGKNYQLVLGENLPNRFTHGITGKILTPSVENKLQLQKLALGGKYVAVVKQNWKGTDSMDAFEILGYNVGLILKEATNNSTEESNTIVLVLGSEDGFEETKVPLNLLKTDYATTDALFDNKFIQT